MRCSRTTDGSRLINFGSETSGLAFMEAFIGHEELINTIYLHLCEAFNNNVPVTSFIGE